MASTSAGAPSEQQILDIALEGIDVLAVERGEHIPRAVSRSMAWKLIAYGDLPAVRIRRAVRVRPADLDAYIAGAIREG